MNRIRPRTISFAVVTIVLGLVAAFIVRRSLDPPPATPRGEVEVVVPRINLPQFARIRPQDVQTIKLPADRVPAGAVRVMPRALGRRVKSIILAGSPVLESSLYGVGETPTLAEQLPPGYRALTIGVNSNNSIAGLLVPESTVDIALTVDAARPELGGTGAAGTKTIVRGVKVLATSETRYKSEERLGRPTRNITVAVTPHQANKLVLAQQYGQLSVTLRSELDADTTAVAWSDDQDLISPQELLGIRPVEVARPVKPKEFHIWRGGQKAVVTFTPEEYSEAQAATIAIGRNDGPIPASFEEVSSHGDGT